MNGVELAFPAQAGAGFPGPHKGDSKAQERATDRGKTSTHGSRRWGQVLVDSTRRLQVVTQHEQRPHPDCTPGQILGGLETLHEDMQPLALLSCSVAPPTKEGAGGAGPGPLWR